MSFEALVKIFEQYGWPGLFAIIVILMIYYILNKKDDKSINVINSGFDRLTETITKQNDTLIGAITTSNEKAQERLFDLVIKQIDEKENKKADMHRASMSMRHEIGEYVDDALFDILQIVNAQRVVLIEFHNSKENLDGLSFLWYDIQHEKQQKGIESISAKVRNLQTTNLRPIIRRVNNEKTHIINLGVEDIENIYNESTVLYDYLMKQDLEHIMYIGIYNTTTNELIGIIAIEWHKGYPYHDDVIDYFVLKEKAGMIEHLYNQARIDLANTTASDLESRRNKPIL